MANTIDKPIKWEERRYCIEYINPRHPLTSDGRLNVRYDRVLTIDEAEHDLTMILSFGGKILDLYIGNVIAGELDKWEPKPAIVDDDDWFTTDWLKTIMNDVWKSIEEKPLEKFVEVLAYNEKWKDGDKKPDGIRIGFLGEDGFVSASWNMEQDCYDTLYEEGDDYYKGNAFVVEEEKKKALPNMPTHYMLIPKCNPRKYEENK